MDLYLKKRKEKTKYDFEDWLVTNGYSFEYEGTFSGNGQDQILQPGQYRVVLRTGFHKAPAQIINNIVLWSPCYDYHFWYQTYDGTWANKHGFTENSAPEQLPYGVTPYSTDTTGWDLGQIDIFYDGDIFVYIITTNQKGKH